MKTISILGSTGSIGLSTLEVVRSYPERYRVGALCAGRNIDLLEEQIRAFAPSVVSVLSQCDATSLRQRLGAQAPEIVAGVEGQVLCATHSDVDTVVSAIVGAAGLVPTMAAVCAGKDVALANKETLVTAGSVFMEAVARHGGQLFPVDSEHSAIFQSLQGHRRQDVSRLILTASGGPFRGRTRADLQNITPEVALAHPNWSMGRKISIDSATLMNKGLEVIEARWLFGVEADRISVMVHPQSIVHSMVEYLDGSVIAQMGIPDMTAPIAYALSYPERLDLDLPPLDLCALGQLSFEAPDLETFPCLGLAYQALESGGTAPAILNAANEIAVEAFLEGRLSFLGIGEVLDAVLQSEDTGALASLDDALDADRRGRLGASELIDQRN